MIASTKTFLIVIPLVLVLTLAPLSPAAALALDAPAKQTDNGQVIEQAFDYLTTQLNPDGGIRWMDDSSSVAATARVIIALAANHLPQDYLQSESGLRPIDYLQANAADFVNQIEADSPAFSVARAGQILAAIAAANENPYAIGDPALNLIAAIQNSYDPNTGAYGATTPGNVQDQVWAMLGLSANNITLPPDAVSWLSAAQAEDGSWDDGYGSTLDTTPLGIMALSAGDEALEDSPALQTAVQFMQDNQQPNGGWQTEWDTTTNANTTGVMLQAITALGQSPSDESWQTAEGDPMIALLALQQESGVIGDDFANSYSTADALTGLSGQHLTNLGDLAQAGIAFDYLLSLQDQSGGWGGVGQTLDVILALQAAGWRPETVLINGITPLDFIADNLFTYQGASPDAIGKAILGLSGAGADPTNFNGQDLVRDLLATYDEEAQSFGTPDNTWHQALAILGLSAAGAEIPEGAVPSLIALQQEDGGWEYSPGFGTWPDNTSLAIQALLAVGYDEDSTVLSEAQAYLRAIQTADGGWGDSSTTAYGLMALNALGESVQDWHTNSGQTPLTSLMSYQKPDGAFVYTWDSPEDNLMATASALLTLFGGHYLVEDTSLESPDFAALIVDPGEEEPVAVCVPLENETLSGADLLAESGVDYSSKEGFVDSIMGISNPEGETNYWSYWRWNGQSWTFNNAGMADSTVLPGSIEAWHFTSWEQFPSLPPDVVPDMTTICGLSTSKDYNDQPHLGYFDLYDSAGTQTILAEPSLSSTKDNTDQTQTSAAATPPATSGPLSDENEAQSRSVLPVLIIGIFGLGLVVVIVLILTGKKE